MARLLVCNLALAATLSSLSCSTPEPAETPKTAKVAKPVAVAFSAEAKAGFDRMAALQGEWVGDGPADHPGQMTVHYALTGGGSALVETLFAGTPNEMVTVYTLEDGQLVLTHYCMLGNQPRMRAEPLRGNVLAFHFIGGANIDPARDPHMHDARFEFVSPDELSVQWTGWNDGHPDTERGPKLHLTRKS